MKIEIQGIRENPVSLLRRAGYAFQRQEGGEMSFIRPFSASGYPRFHIYAKVVDVVNLEINIHLDMKKETYGDDTRHHGEYDGNEGPLKDEVERLQKLFQR